jgi:hypothetical protein
MGKLVNSRESSIKDTLSDPNFGDDLGQVMKLGYSVAVWSCTVNSTQNLIKELSDTLKSVVQKGG